MGKGFFSTEDTSGIVRKERKSKSSTVLSCYECGLDKSCTTPKMPVSGKGKLKILLLNEYPGKDDDDEGTQFKGKSGEILRSIIKELGYNIDTDFWKANAVCCRPSKPPPSPVQILACRKHILSFIEENKPTVIIPFGKIAIDSIIGQKLTGRMKGTSIQDLVNCRIPDQDYKCWILPSWHPSAVFRFGEDDYRENSGIRDQISLQIKEAIRIVKDEVPFYESNYSSDCFSITDVAEAIDVIRKMKEKKIIAFDYETTGRKPQREGHRIVTVSVSDGLFGYAFPYFNNKEFREEWLSLMESNTGKIAHNAKFEAMWTKTRGGYDNKEGVWPNNIFWDTMLSVRILDNRKNKPNLKLQLYTLLGIAGYDSEVDGFLESTKEEETIYGDNYFNRIDEIDVNILLKYNSMDALGTYKLWEYQNNHMNKPLKRAQDLFINGSIALAKAEYNGMAYDSETSSSVNKQITERMEYLESTVLSSKELQKWDKPNPFRMSAPQDLPYLLFNVLGYTSDEKTETGKPKADKDTMEKFDIPLVKNVLEWRKWAKVRDTYLKGFDREAVDGYIHPYFNLHTVDTFRSSSSAPNFQNIPKRDQEVAKMLRKILKPRLNHKLGEFDYKAMEVNIIACCNKDPTLIKFIEDGFDMHRDIAAKIFIKEPKEVTKVERYLGKNGFVFPTFYGSYFANTAPAMWNDIPDETRLHLKSKGIKNVRDFTSHVEKVEKDFWENRFPVAHEYMENALDTYEKKGYVDLFTGFRCRGPLTRNQIFNYPVQGAAFHCLLWTFTKLTERLEKRKMDTRLIGQIHDAIIADIHPDEEEVIDYFIWDYGTQKIREEFKWIIVPLGIEKSIGPVNGSWAELKEIGLLEE